MRRILAISAPVALLALGVFACTDDPTNPASGSLNLDGSTLDVFIPVGNPIDAATPDGDVPDAPVPPAPVAVTVQVLGSTGRQNVPVVFEYTDGTLEDVKTDATGVAKSTGATAPVKATALLSPSDQGGPYPAPVTWLGIAGGDILQIQGVSATDLDALARYNVTFPADDASFQVQASVLCRTSSEGTSATLYLRNGCTQDDGKVTLLGIRNDGDGFAFLKDQTAPTLAGTAASLTNFVAADVLHVTVTNIPEVSHGLRTTQIYQHRPYNEQFSNVDNGTAVDVPVPTDFATSHQVALEINGGSQYRALIKSAPPNAQKAIALDATNLLPALGSFSAATGADPQHATIAWTGSSAGTLGGLAQVRYPGTTGARTWTFVVPAGTTSVTIPKLPTAEASFGASTDATLDDYGTQQNIVAFLKAPAVFTAAAFRSKAATYTTVGDLDARSLLEDAPAPIDGDYALTAIVPNDL